MNTKRRIKKVLAFLLAFVLVLQLMPNTLNHVKKANAATTVSTEAELRAALASDAFDIVLGNDIVLTETGDITNSAKFSITKGGTIDGNGHTIEAAVTGTNDLGVTNDSASDYNVFYISGDVNVNIHDLTIKGGCRSAIYVTGPTTILKQENVTITCSGGGSNSGGAISNNLGAKILLKNCSLTRNVAEFGGAFVNNGTMVLDGCSVVENRNIGGFNNGGGACQNSGKLYLNNCTFANNQSSEIGGAINNIGGDLYVMNSTISGNISTSYWGDANYGGGIGINGGSVYAANSIISKNYATIWGNTYVNSDIGKVYSNNIYVYYSVYGAYIIHYTGTEGTLPNEIANEKILTNDVFRYYLNSFLLTAEGLRDESANSSLLSLKRPILIRKSVLGVSQFVAPLNAAQYGSGFTTAGTDTYFYYSADLSTVEMAYGDIPTAITASITNISGDPSSHKVSTYQDGTARSAKIPGAAGVSNVTYYSVAVSQEGHGSVTGGTAFGDAYENGDVATLSAVPDSGYHFVKWLRLNEDGTTWSNFITLSNFGISVTEDITLKAVFADGVKLTGLNLSEGTLSTAFSSDELSYTASVDYSVTSTSITGTSNGAYTGMTIRKGSNSPIALTSGVASTQSLDVGDNTFTISLDDGKQTNSYTITITRANPKLLTVTASSAITGVENGTAKTVDGLGLPSTVTVQTEDDTVTLANVTWDLSAVLESAYNPSAMEEQTFSVPGTVSLPVGIINTDSVSLSTSISVTVSAVGTVAAPTASITAGTYVGAKTVELTTTTGGADIYYSTNGDTPTTLYTGPITVDSSMTIKAVAKKAGMFDSNLSTLEYTIHYPTVTSVTVTPDTISVQKESTKQFYAVTGVLYGASTNVNWSVSGNKSSGTSISSDGILSVGSDESAKTITVKAISDADNSKRDEATVTVTPILYTITPSAGKGGSIDPRESVSVEKAHDKTITITSDSGYHIQDVMIDGTSRGGINSYTFTNVTKNHSIEAIFAKDVEQNPVDSETGNVTLDTNQGDGAPEASLSTSTETLMNLLLNQEEKTLFANGTDIRFLLKIGSLDGKVSQDEQAQINENLNGYEIGQYLDISLWKIIGSAQSQITNTGKKIKITVEVPENLLNSNSNKARTYQMIRLHDGTVSTLKDLDSDDKTITFNTNEFSTYAIIYNDADNKTDELSKTADVLPKTGDNNIDATNYYWLYAIIIISVFGIITTYMRRKEKMQ